VLLGCKGANGKDMSLNMSNSSCGMSKCNFIDHDWIVMGLEL
jgi:hypothetical protein